MHYIQTKCT